MARGEAARRPLLALLANVLLDEVDRESERRDHCFARCADDANVYVRSQGAGERVMTLLRWLYDKVAPRSQRKQERGRQRIRSQIPRLQSMDGTWKSGETGGWGHTAGNIQTADP